jgi:hypothetical protein
MNNGKELWMVSALKNKNIDYYPVIVKILKTLKPIVSTLTHEQEHSKQK